MTEEAIKPENKANKGGKIWTIVSVIVVLVLLVGILYFKNKSSSVSVQDAQFIGNNSVLYVQAGCSHCITQEKMFGENVKYLTIIDCFNDLDACIKANITATPTWVINGRYYEGVKTVEELKNWINEV